jgi:hypothetical protein
VCVPKKGVCVYLSNLSNIYIKYMILLKKKFDFTSSNSIRTSRGLK